MTPASPMKKGKRRDEENEIEELVADLGYMYALPAPYM